MIEFTIFYDGGSLYLCRNFSKNILENLQSLDIILMHVIFQIRFVNKTHCIQFFCSMVTMVLTSVHSCCFLVTPEISTQRFVAILRSQQVKTLFMIYAVFYGNGYKKLFRIYFQNLDAKCVKM